MAGDKNTAKGEPIAAGFKSDSKLAEQKVVLQKEATVGDKLSAVNGNNVQKSVAEQGFYQPPPRCYDCYYPGYGGTFNQMDGHNYMSATGGSYTGMQSDNGLQQYYLSCYPYATGTFMGVDGQQSYYPSAGHSWDSTYVSGKPNDFASKKPINAFHGKSSNSPLDNKSRQSSVSSNMSRSTLENQHLKSPNKYTSGYQLSGPGKGYQSGVNYPLYINQNQGLYGQMNYSPQDYSFRLRERSYRSGESETSELTRGPRGQMSTKPKRSLTEDEKQGLSSRRERCNLKEFKTEYDNAKFYVIKSYSEDDVHKCVKYDVWSSTPNGNKKLDAAFQQAEGSTSETGIDCPIFLFFSVNASGQFVGVAEMDGRVDFDKNMDFWQVDKWTGFFPVKWHIIKDIPNTLLRHIVLENNDNRPVTYTRDTQEIGLKQGLEMLSIFKNYSEKTSLLDDFLFYDDREKQLKAKRTKAALQAEMYSNNDLTKNLNTVERMSIGVPVSVDNSNADPTSTLINLTRNLSLNSHSPTLKSRDDKSKSSSVRASE